MAATMLSTKIDRKVVPVTEEHTVEPSEQNEEKDIDEPGPIPAKYRGTTNDQKDMNEMGKKQVLRVCL